MASDARSVWRSLSPQGRITINYLWATAREWGWRPERPADTRVVEQSERAAPVAAPNEDQAKKRRAQEAKALSNKLLTACAVDRHPYLESKGWPDMQWLVATRETHGHLIPRQNPPHRLHEWFDMGPLLVVTMRESRSNQVQTLQFIAPGGEKKFLPGGKASGSVYRIGPRDGRGRCGTARGLPRR